MLKKQYYTVLSYRRNLSYLKNPENRQYRLKLCLLDVAYIKEFFTLFV